MGEEGGEGRKESGYKKNYCKIFKLSGSQLSYMK